MNLSLEPVPVGEMVAESLSSRQPDGRRPADPLRKPLRPTTVRARASMSRPTASGLRQVLLNLLSNAVKYNREGGQCDAGLPTNCPSARTAQARLRLMEVTDTGAGLTAEEISRLFTPFERLGAENTATEGTGLGLALSKGLDRDDGRMYRRGQRAWRGQHVLAGVARWWPTRSKSWPGDGPGRLQAGGLDGEDTARHGTVHRG